MDSPFKKISDAFQPEYNVNFSIEKTDGSILLTLTGDAGVAVKRYIGANQWRDPQQLERLITSLQFSLAIEQGASLPIEQNDRSGMYGLTAHPQSAVR
jgi:hypothetical protein